MLVLFVGVPIHDIVLMLDILIFLHRTGAPSESGPHCQRFTITYIQHSVGLLWTSAQPNAHIKLTTETHAPGGILTHNPSRRTAAAPSL